jgi:hypothetical protein
MVHGMGRDSELARRNFTGVPSCLDGPSLFVRCFCAGTAC